LIDALDPPRQPKKAEVGIFFEGTGPDSSDDQIRAIAPKHPAFEVLPAD
jgi:hypothetical protein